MQLLSCRSLPRAILHLDGDSFFASCEVALNPKLKGKPVVTGLERGIASSLTYEAKALGVKRGMPIFQIKQICPQAIILPSDYETYSLFSQRMYNVVRRYTSTIEEYSIDECFAEITGLRRPLKKSYAEIAKEIKEKLEWELGLTFSVGLAPNKTLAKIASKWQKPNGLTIITGKQLGLFLPQLAVEDVWGIGANTAAYLNSLGIKTAWELACQNELYIKEKLSKPFWETYRELKGEVVFELNTETKDDYQSISKTKTFLPASADKEYVFAQLSKNIENACIKLRRHQLAARLAQFFLKTQDFRFSGLKIKLPYAINTPNQITQLIRPYFDQVWRQKVIYRATGIILGEITDQKSGQLDLFGDSQKNETLLMVYKNIDLLEEKFGKHTVFLGSSFKALKGRYQNQRQVKTGRQNNLFAGETERKKLALPMLGLVQ